MTEMFNPAAWLAQFAQSGGAYGTNGQRLVLAIVPGAGSDKEMRSARLLVATLTDTQRAEVVRYLSSPVMVED